MNYSKEQKESIEKVRTVFLDYIKNSRTLDLLWSDKLGYLLLTGITKEMDDVYMHPILLEDAETLCHKVLYEIACDVLEAEGNYDDIFDASPIERDRILQAFSPYMVQLPEYEYVIEELFRAPSDEA